MINCCSTSQCNWNEKFDINIANSEDGITINVSPKDKSKVKSLQKLGAHENRFHEPNHPPLKSPYMPAPGESHFLRQYWEYSNYKYCGESGTWELKANGRWRWFRKGKYSLSSSSVLSQMLWGHTLKCIRTCDTKQGVKIRETLWSISSKSFLGIPITNWNV